VDKTAFVEFGGVKDRDDLVSLLNHDLIEEGFLHAGSRDAIIEGEGVHAEEEFVAAEVPEYGERQGSDHGETIHAHGTAEKDDVETFVLGQFCGNIHRVGEDTEVSEPAEMAGYLKGGGTGIKHDKIAVLDESGSFLPYPLFLAEVEHAFFGDRGVLVGVFDRFTHGSATGSDEEVAVLEDGEILSDGHFRDTGILTELRDEDFVLLLKEPHDKGSAFFCRRRIHID